MRVSFRNDLIPSRSFFGDFEPLFDSAFFPIRGWPQLARERDELAASFESPRAEVEQNDEAFILRVDLPGVKKEDLKIDMVGRTVKILAERKRDASSVRYERHFTFPVTVEMSKLEASLESGVLTIAVPKAEEERPRSVEVQEGRSGLLSRLLGTSPLGQASVKSTN